MPVIKKEKCRFFDYLVTFVFVATCLRYGLEDFATGTPSSLKKEHVFAFEGYPKASGETLAFQPYNLMKLISENKWPKEILYEKLSKEKDDAFKKQISENDLVYKGTVTEQIQMFLIQPLFVFYFESIKDEIIAKHGEAENWPDCLNFGRVIRNTLSHGGKIFFKNKNMPSVKWKGLTYSPKDNGKEIFLKDLGVSDIIFLMLEMNDAL